jgi:outer membrane protein assembly factor BamB
MIKYFELSFKYSFLSFIFLLSSCTSLSALKFWENEDFDLDEPMPLKNITEKKEVVSNWTLNFTGKNDLGNFIPSFSSKSIYFADSEGNVKSIDIASGNINWQKQFKSLSAGIASGYGISVISDNDGNVIALDQADGSVIWTKNVQGEVLSQAVISAKSIFIKTGSGELISLDKNTGEISWSYRAKLPPLTIKGSSRPVINEDIIYASFDNGRLVAFEIDTGYPLWDGAISYTEGVSELENIIDSDSSPLIEGGFAYTTNYQGNLNIFDVAQRRSIWQSKLSSFYTPIITRGLIILIESNSNIKSFSINNLQESWQSKSYLNRGLSNAVSFEGYIIIGDYEGYIHMIDPISGITVGRKKISKNPIKNIVSRSKNFYVVDQSFKLISLSI